MARGRVDRLWMTCGRAVAATVVGCTQVRAALKHLARNLDLWLAGVVTRSLGPAARIFRNATRLCSLDFMLGRPPISAPLPNVADHVVDAVAVRRERHDRRRALIAIFLAVLVRKRALPSIRHVLAAGCKFIAPRKLRLFKPAARREFPFGFRRQFLT